MHRPDYAGKRVLITGGLGFIGSSLAIELVESGADVTVVDSMIPAYGANLFNIEPVRDRLHINYSDIRDRYSLEHLVREKEHIFNLAGQLSHIDSMRDPMTDLEINCSAQLSLLECLRRVNPEVKVVFGSTRQLYGRPQYLPVDEDHPIRPVDVNGINNWASESFFRLYHEVHGIASVSLRLTNTYGPRMDLQSNTKGFLGIFVRRALGRRDAPRSRPYGAHCRTDILPGSGRRTPPENRSHSRSSGRERSRAREYRNADRLGSLARPTRGRRPPWGPPRRPVRGRSRGGVGPADRAASG